MSFSISHRPRFVARLVLPNRLSIPFQAAVIGTLAAALAFHNLDFLYGAHVDEPRKVGFVAGNAHNYFHPPLLIVLARFSAWLSGALTDQDRLLAGRQVSALAAVAASVVFFLVLQRYADRLQAFLWSCIFAVSPAIAVHAHYLKEDALLVFAICLSLHALVRLKENGRTPDLVYFGFALGLADSAKYVGVTNSLALLAFAIWHCRLGMRSILIVFAAAAFTVAMVFLLSFSTEAGSGLGSVLSGLAKELKHANRGHDLKEWAWAGYGLTHFRYHLIPSLTGMTVLIGLVAIGLAIIVDRSRRVACLAVAALAWLLLLELSPLKIVGSMRYVLPVVIYFLLASGIACSRSIAARSQWVGTALALAALSVTAHAGISYVGNMDPSRDTRSEAVRFLSEKGISNFVADYPIGYPVHETKDYRGLASSDFLLSLRFERHLRGGDLREQTPQIYEFAGMFHCLEGHVVAVFSKLYGDFGFVAPTVKIYDLRAGRSCIPETSSRP